MQNQIPITVLSEEDEKYLFDDDKIPVTNVARVSAEQKLNTHCDEEALSKRKKMKVAEFTSITHQGKTLKMLGEIAPVWRPKTRPKNKLRLNMKKLLNPKLVKEKVTLIEDSSSKDKFDDVEDGSKDKKPIESKVKSVMTDTKISNIFLEIRNQMLQEQQQSEVKSSCLEKKEMVEEKSPCNAKNE